MVTSSFCMCEVPSGGWILGFTRMDGGEVSRFRDVESLEISWRSLDFLVEMEKLQGVFRWMEAFLCMFPASDCALLAPSKIFCKPLQCCPICRCICCHECGVADKRLQACRRQKHHWQSRKKGLLHGLVRAG